MVKWHQNGAQMTSKMIHFGIILVHFGVILGAFWIQNVYKLREKQCKMVFQKASKSHRHVINFKKINAFGVNLLTKNDEI